MKTRLFFLSLCAANSIFAASAECSKTDTIPILFQRYLSACSQGNAEHRPVHLRSSSREKDPCFTDMTFLDLDLSSKMPIEIVAERVLYGDADIVHLGDISIEDASCLYRILETTYPHFIYVPNRKQDVFIASKYPLSQARVTMAEKESTAHGELLEFAIHGANTYYAAIESEGSSSQITHLTNASDVTTTPVFLFDLPATLTVVKQQFSPLQVAQRVKQLPEETFEILQIGSRGGGHGNDKEGAYAGGRVDMNIGPRGEIEWSASAKGGYRDDNGNYAEMEVSRNDRGETNISAEAGTDKGKNER